MRTIELNRVKLPMLLKLDYSRNQIDALDQRVKQAEEFMKLVQNAPSLERAQNYARIYLEGKL
jgi:hypothetical protein